MNTETFEGIEFCFGFLPPWAFFFFVCLFEESISQHGKDSFFNCQKHHQCKSDVSTVLLWSWPSLWRGRTYAMPGQALMETIVSLLSPAAWKLVKQGSIRKGLGSPQASSSPRLTSEHQESNSQNVWGRCGGKHTKSDETLTSWGSPTPPVDLPIHGVLHKVWPHEIENSTTTGVLWNLHSKFSNESTVITGFDTRVWVFC